MTMPPPFAPPSAPFPERPSSTPEDPGRDPPKSGVKPENQFTEENKPGNYFYILPSNT
jgi:hypothetical protein